MKEKKQLDIMQPLFQSYVFLNSKQIVLISFHNVIEDQDIRMIYIKYYKLYLRSYSKSLIAFNISASR